FEPLPPADWACKLIPTVAKTRVSVVFVEMRFITAGNFYRSLPTKICAQRFRLQLFNTVVLKKAPQRYKPFN
ncbi:MAG: hypothetical protein KDC54_11135, partial [Lewinella sp.]|nr:hypothetical protein [Lewinella sp.]